MGFPENRGGPSQTNVTQDGPGHQWTERRVGGGGVGEGHGGAAQGQGTARRREEAGRCKVASGQTRQG